MTQLKHVRISPRSLFDRIQIDTLDNLMLDYVPLLPGIAHRISSWKAFRRKTNSQPRYKQSEEVKLPLQSINSNRSCKLTPVWILSSIDLIITLTVLVELLPLTGSELIASQGQTNWPNTYQPSSVSITEAANRSLSPEAVPSSQANTKDVIYFYPQTRVVRDVDEFASILSESMGSLNQSGQLISNVTLELNPFEAARLGYFKHSLTISVILSVAYTMVFVIGLIGNSLVVVIVCKSPRMRTVTNYFIANLALADILVLLFCLPATLISNMFIPYVLGLFVCKTVSYSQGVAVSASINTMLAVTLDRFMAISYPMDWHMSRRMARWTIAGIWIFSLTIAMPWAIYFELVPFPLDNKLFEACQESWPSPNFGLAYFVVANLFLLYLLPAVVIILCYLGIWYKIKRRYVPGLDMPRGLKIELIMQKSKLKVVRMMMVVVIIFLLSWLPLYIISTRIKLKPDRDPSEDLFLSQVIPIAQWLGASNSCINPILYTLFNRKYKRGFIDLIRFGLCCRPISADVEGGIGLTYANLTTGQTGLNNNNNTNFNTHSNNNSNNNIGHQISGQTNNKLAQNHLGQSTTRLDSKPTRLNEAEGSSYGGVVRSAESRKESGQSSGSKLTRATSSATTTWNSSCTLSSGRERRALAASKTRAHRSAGSTVNDGHTECRSSGGVLSGDSIRSAAGDRVADVSPEAAHVLDLGTPGRSDSQLGCSISVPRSQSEAVRQLGVNSTCSQEYSSSQKHRENHKKQPVDQRGPNSDIHQEKAHFRLPEQQSSSGVEHSDRTDLQMAEGHSGRPNKYELANEQADEVNKAAASVTSALLTDSCGSQSDYCADYRLLSIRRHSGCCSQPTDATHINMDKKVRSRRRLDAGNQTRACQLKSAAHKNDSQSEGHHVKLRLLVGESSEGCSQTEIVREKLIAANSSSLSLGAQLGADLSGDPGSLPFPGNGAFCVRIEGHSELDRKCQRCLRMLNGRSKGPKETLASSTASKDGGKLTSARQNETEQSDVSGSSDHRRLHHHRQHHFRKHRHCHRHNRRHHEAESHKHHEKQQLHCHRHRAASHGTQIESGNPNGVQCLSLRRDPVRSQANLSSRKPQCHSSNNANLGSVLALCNRKACVGSERSLTATPVPVSSSVTPMGSRELSQPQSPSVEVDVAITSDHTSDSRCSLASLPDGQDEHDLQLSPVNSSMSASRRAKAACSDSR